MHSTLKKLLLGFVNWRLLQKSSTGKNGETSTLCSDQLQLICLIPQSLHLRFRAHRMLKPVVKLHLPQPQLCSMLTLP